MKFVVRMSVIFVIVLPCWQQDEKKVTYSKQCCLCIVIRNALVMC